MDHREHGDPPPLDYATLREHNDRELRRAEVLAGGGPWPDRQERRRLARLRALQGWPPTVASAMPGSEVRSEQPEQPISAATLAWLRAVRDRNRGSILEVVIPVAEAHNARLASGRPLSR